MGTLNPHSYRNSIGNRGNKFGVDVYVYLFRGTGLRCCCYIADESSIRHFGILDQSWAVQ